MKRLTNHNIYEVWNEWAARSVFVDHKPTMDELMYIVDKECWCNDPAQALQFIKKHIRVDKLTPMYTS